jgi:hypothetical protein
MTMNIREASTVRIFLLRLASTAATVTICALISSAGGPKKIAGTAYFDSSVTGQPLTWAQGAVNYYTDQGNLSVIFPNASANSLVAGAFGRWTEIPTAALTVTAGGSLAEDVSSANVTRNADGTISIPADIQPNAIGAPIGIVYDFDGAVNASPTPCSEERTTSVRWPPTSTPWLSSTDNVLSSHPRLPMCNTGSYA